MQKSVMIHREKFRLREMTDLDVVRYPVTMGIIQSEVLNASDNAG